MRAPALSRMLLLAGLLAASHVIYAGHMATHLGSGVGKCEWCVCQAQTLAGPIPVVEAPVAEPAAALPFSPSVLSFHAFPPFHCCQPRAPPSSPE